MNEIIQKMNRLTIDSREVARMVEKRHADLLRDLNIFSNYLSDSIERKIALNEFWQESSYKDKIGRKLTCYLITKKGCEFIAHKMTGKKGAIFTATYINRFHAMEEALKHPKPKQRWLPPQILRCKYFNGVPCMTLADLEFVTGFDHATALWSLKRYYIPYTMLTKETLFQYRYENNLHTCNSRLIILSQASVVTLLQKTGRYTAEIIEQLRKYFAEERQIQTVRTEVITVATDEIIGWIDDIRGHMDTLDGLLYKYQKNNPIKLQEALKETIRSIGADICEHTFRLTCTKYETKSI